LTLIASIAWFGLLVIGIFATGMAGGGRTAVDLDFWNVWGDLILLLVFPVVSAIVGWIGAFWQRSVLISLGTIALLAWLTFLLMLYFQGL
jgi:hypothetical protein